jgi:hypothetical protein
VKGKNPFKTAMPTQTSQYDFVGTSFAWTIGGQAWGEAMRPSQLILLTPFVLGGCGSEETMLASDWSPAHLSIDLANAYWFGEAMSTSIKAVPLGGGTPMILATLPAAINGAKVDGSILYYGGCGAVMKFPLRQDASPQPLITISDCVKEITTDDENIYWSNLSGTIFRLMKSGGTEVPVFVGSNIACMAGDPSRLYWIDASQGLMAAQPGGAPVVLVPVQASSCSLALDTDYVYWVDYDKNGVFRVPKAGGDPVVIATGQIHPNQIAVDETLVYWTTSGRYDDWKEEFVDGAVWRARKDSSNQAHRIASQSNPHGIAVDAKYLYWATWPHYTRGGVFKKPK